MGWKQWEILTCHTCAPSPTAGNTLFLLRCPPTSLSFFPPQVLSLPCLSSAPHPKPLSFSLDPEGHHGPIAHFLTISLLNTSPDVLVTRILGATVRKKEKWEELATLSLLQIPQEIVKPTPGLAVTGACQIHSSFSPKGISCFSKTL